MDDALTIFFTIKNMINMNEGTYSHEREVIQATLHTALENRNHPHLKDIYRLYHMIPVDPLSKDYTTIRIQIRQAAEKVLQDHQVTY
jgi:hypothetical protein